MPKVYIIILNYCGAQDTIACLETVFKMSYSNYHVVLVDNCSPDNSISIIQDWAIGKLSVEESNKKFSSLINPYVQKPIQYHFFDEGDIEETSGNLSHCALTIIKAKSNRGFSAGNNIALQYALTQGDANYFWLLNNDTLVTQNSLSELLNCHQQYKEEDRISIVGGKLLYYDEPETIQCLGGGTYNELLGIVKEMGDRLPERLEVSGSNPQLDYISGACMLVKSRFVEEVGFLSEDYFFYYEELDWCTRGRKKGWNISYTSKAVIYHKVGATVNANQKRKQKSEMSDYYIVRNKLLYASKYNGIFVNIVIRIALLGVVVNRIYRGQFKRVLMIVRLALAKY